MALNSFLLIFFKIKFVYSNVKMYIISVLPSGTVKSSKVLGEINSITVARPLVIKEYMIILFIDRDDCKSGISKPNRKNERNDTKNENPKNVIEPSRVLVVPVYFN